MTFGHVVAPARATLRRRLAVLLPLAVGLVVGAILWRAGERRRTAQPPGSTAVVEHVCTYPAEPTPPPPPEPVKPANTDAWAGLERCLRQDAYALANWVTVADVSRWVVVEHDPIWHAEGYWWFPLSDEGDSQMPSGFYVGVPLEASAPCRGAIIN